MPLLAVRSPRAVLMAAEAGQAETRQVLPETAQRAGPVSPTVRPCSMGAAEAEGAVGVAETTQTPEAMRTLETRAAEVTQVPEAAPVESTQAATAVRAVLRQRADQLN